MPETSQIVAWTGIFREGDREIAHHFADSIYESGQNPAECSSHILAPLSAAGMRIINLDEILLRLAVMARPNKQGELTSVIPDWMVKPHWRDRLIADISEYAGRTQGWDGYQASPIDPSAIHDAKQFVGTLPDDIPPPLDQPCPDGEVSLVWRFGKSFAEIGFSGDRNFYWYCTNGSDENSGENVSVNTGIPAGLRQIMGFEINHALTSQAPAFYNEFLLAA